MPNLTGAWFAGMGNPEVRWSYRKNEYRCDDFSWSPDWIEAMKEEIELREDLYFEAGLSTREAPLPGFGYP